ncbi:MAG: helix-turn-helix transcriptional regulator, partial [Leptospiraceae bacterium]|nr:helix-turn-helix transcriptional regulator [Leptospiraceae bacterium]
ERMERCLRTERLYADEDLTLDKLAASVQIQPAQLSELLNNVMGVDFRSYVNDFRISAAKQMLIQELDRSVLSIGFAVGFNSKSAFNRNFKNIAGQTPAAYRAAHAQPGKEV